MKLANRARALALPSDSGSTRLPMIILDVQRAARKGLTGETSMTDALEDIYAACRAG